MWQNHRDLYLAWGEGVNDVGKGVKDDVGFGDLGYAICCDGKGWSCLVAQASKLAT